VAKKKPDQWMPLDIGAYLADTAFLTTEAHGVYFLMLMAYWRLGPLPDNDEQLAAIAKLPPPRWAKYRPILGQLPFFDIRDGKWHQKRADEERKKAAGLMAKRSQAGGNGAAKRWQTHSKRIATTTANGQQNDGPSPSPSPVEKPNPDGLGKKPTKGKTEIAPDWKLGERDREFCRKRGWPEDRIDSEADQFRDGARAHKRRYADWGAAWRTWVRNYDKFNASRGSGKNSRRPATGERRNAIYASVADELELGGTAAAECGRPAASTSGGDAEPIAVVATGPRGVDGTHVREPANATEGELENLAGLAGQVSAGRAETRDGQGAGNAQMGDPAEDRASGGMGGNRRQLSAPAECQIHAGEGHHAPGLGQEGSEPDYWLIEPKFRRL